MKRAELFDALQPVVGDDLVIVSLGGNAKSWYARRPRNNYIVHHAMGLTTAVGLGLALAQPSERIWVFEGDGGMLMNLGMLAVLGAVGPNNLVVVIVDNEIYESGGRLSTLSASSVDFVAVAKGCGITHAQPVAQLADVEPALATAGDQFTLLAAKVDPGADGESLRFEYVENKLRFADDVEAKLGLTLRQPADAYTRTRAQ